MFDWGYIVGYLGILSGLMVAPPQLLKILRTKNIDGISYTTYVFLVLALILYLLHAIYIQSPVFIVAQSLNLVSNTAILIIMLRRKYLTK
mgnify:CR=1 FL=1